MEMDLHRLAEERSVAYHRVIAERLLRQPEVLERARRRVQSWLFLSFAVTLTALRALERARRRVQSWLASGAPFYARKWAEILAGDPPTA